MACLWFRDGLPPGFSLTFWLNDSANERMVPALEDLDLLASSEPFDLYEELDFYDWLAEHEHPS